MTDDLPEPSIAVSPIDQSSDRARSDADQVTLVGLLENLAVRADEVVETSNNLAAAALESQQKETTARRRFRQIVIGGIVGVLLILGGQAVIDVLGYRYLSSGHQIRDTILSCVEPSGSCFRQAQARTGQAVGSINEVSTFAAACAASPAISALPIDQRVVAVEACIQHELKK